MAADRALRFASDTGGPFEFRIFERNTTAVRFEGLSIQWNSRDIQPVPGLPRAVGEAGEWCFTPYGDFVKR
jgi:hypothetical protein